MFILPSEYWEVRKTKDKGRGIFAKKDIPAGTIIGDYIGKMIRVSEEDQYEKDDSCFYLMYYHEKASIFPNKRKPGIHFINHSCEPNSYMYSYQGHTLYFALRHIFAGEELTVSYLLGPLDKDCEPCEHICKCGSETCKNLMHSTHKEYDAWSDYDNELTENVKLPRVTFGKDLPTLPKYPETIKDNTVYPLFGSANKPALTLADTKIPSRKELRMKLRETGQKLHFKKLGITVTGISDNHVICQATN